MLSRGDGAGAATRLLDEVGRLEVILDVAVVLLLSRTVIFDPTATQQLLTLYHDRSETEFRHYFAHPQTSN